MKKTKIIFLLIFLIPLLGISQDTKKKKESKDANTEVVICEDNDKLSFHSHAQCIGLETCESNFAYVEAVAATKTHERKACCICWDNPGEDCKNDNPDYYSDEIDYNDSGFYVDDLWWLDSGEPYFLVIALVSSVALISNEVYIGGTYAFLPPKIATNLSQTMEQGLAGSLIFRKNFKQNALEYGFSTSTYNIQDNRTNQTEYFDVQNYVVSLAYLYEMNQHFSSQKNPMVNIKFYAGPIVTYGWNFLDNQLIDKLGIGGTVAVSIPMGSKFHFDVRSNFTNYSSEVSFGVRWLYQERLPWRR